MTIREHNRRLLLEHSQDNFIDNAIQLSQMVADNRVSSTNAKIVFKEIWSNYRFEVGLINLAVRDGN